MTRDGLSEFIPAIAEGGIVDEPKAATEVNCSGMSPDEIRREILRAGHAEGLRPDQSRALTVIAERLGSAAKAVREARELGLKVNMVCMLEAE